MGGVTGYDDTNNRSAFTQAWPGGSQPDLLPFHFNTKKEDGECTYDLDHGWPAEHLCWDGGAMDAFVSTHTSTQYEGCLGVNTMGYYEKGDIPFYWDLASKFTICDNYFCSVLGPTHPNRLMAISAPTSIPAGVAGGPIIVTNSDQTIVPVHVLVGDDARCPDRSTASRWKCYNPYGSNYQPGSSAFVSKNMLLYFKQYSERDPSSAPYQNAFNYYGPNVNGGLTAANPNTDDFAADVASNTSLRCRGSSRPTPTTSTRRRPPSSASGTRSRSWTPSCPTPRCGPARCCSSCTTRTTGSSTTCRPRPRRPAPTVST